jgi:hypothetical protein
MPFMRRDTVQRAAVSPSRAKVAIAVFQLLRLALASGLELVTLRWLNRGAPVTNLSHSGSFHS